MVDLLPYALSGLMLLTLVASVVCWLRLLPAIFRQGLRGFADSWLPARTRTRPFWGFAEFLIMFGSMMVIGQLALLVAIENEWIARPEPNTGALEQSTMTGVLVMHGANYLANLVAVIITLIWMRNIDRDAVRKLGLICDRDAVRLGLKATVMILPPVILISFAAAFLIPYEHPVLDVLADLRSPGVFAVIFIGTAILTPVFEEMFFRGLLQGALQGFADRNLGIVGEPSQSSANAGEPSAYHLDVAGDGAWRPVAYWPVIAASLLFASMHIGQGAAPIPLFFLSLGLGYLYRQTGSLIPCIVVHMILNGTTLIAEFIKPAL
ncbi:MAG: CPBP family intramembrane metalloprotease [Rubripirellula sp.]|nr:CPBP family intramembrane metalloprotease [Rubripirellula sp.]